MINVNRDSNIYILCPANYETGGTELAHQLVDFLIAKNRNAFIVYLVNNDFQMANVPQGFRKYNINVASEPIDDINNILILPESFLFFGKKFQKIQLIFWWMSIDNYYSLAPLWEFFKLNGLKNTLYLAKVRYKMKQSLLSGMSFKDINKFENRILHVYQSTYAKYTLLNNNVNYLLPLSDYINTEFLIGQDLNIKKQDIILFNPAKGLKFTKKIIKLLPNYRFVALEKLTRSELSEYLKISKLYIDFGNHPGKDRLPREAVLNNCCLIVGKKGSAKFFEDIAIPSKYKFDEKDIDLIIEAIKDIVLNYDSIKNDFIFYRNRILLEKEKFHSEIEEIFNC
jgi:hypothetical protein